MAPRLSARSLELAQTLVRIMLSGYTELQSVTGELDAVRGLSDTLRAQNHEAANRLHTVVSLLELGRQAFDGREIRLELNRLKTTRLFEASVGCGLWVAGVPAAEQQRGRAFGADFGGIAAWGLLLVSCVMVNRAVMMPPHIPGAKFVGSKECAECHAESFPVWEASKHHVSFKTLQEVGKQFHLNCIGCHAGMDPLAQAFAYYDFDPALARLVYTPGAVHPTAPPGQGCPLLPWRYRGVTA